VRKEDWEAEEEEEEDEGEEMEHEEVERTMGKVQEEKVSFTTEPFGGNENASRFRSDR